MTDKYEYEYAARRLSVTQWEFLADHCEGSRPIVRHNAQEDRTRFSLICKHLLTYKPQAPATPTHTILTEKGHGVMCAALGMMADMLDANNLAFDNAGAIEDWYTLSPQYRTKERLIEMVSKPKFVERKYAYGKMRAAARPRDPADVKDAAGSAGRPVR